MKVKIGNDIKIIEGENYKVYEIFKILNFNPEEYIVIRNNEVLTEDEIIKGDDEIELIRVISGGI
ncbi:MAG: MoaD/ThiS family protein [Candidatus Hydrothermales bacterium]